MSCGRISLPNIPNSWVNVEKKKVAHSIKLRPSGRRNSGMVTFDGDNDVDDWWKAFKNQYKKTLYAVAKSIIKYEEKKKQNDHIKTIDQWGTTAPIAKANKAYYKKTWNEMINKAKAYVLVNDTPIKKEKRKKKTSNRNKTNTLSAPTLPQHNNNINNDSINNSNTHSIVSITDSNSNSNNNNNDNNSILYDATTQSIHLSTPHQIPHRITVSHENNPSLITFFPFNNIVSSITEPIMTHLKQLSDQMGAIDANIIDLHSETARNLVHIKDIKKTMNMSNQSKRSNNNNKGNRYKSASSSSSRVKKQKINDHQKETRAKMGEDVETQAEFILALLRDPTLRGKVLDDTLIQNDHNQRKKEQCDKNKNDLHWQYREEYIRVSCINGSKSKTDEVRVIRQCDRGYKVNKENDTPAKRTRPIKHNQFDNNETVTREFNKHLGYIYSKELGGYRDESRFKTWNTEDYGVVITYKPLLDLIKCIYHEITTKIGYHGCLRGTVHRLNVEQWIDEKIGRPIKNKYLIENSNQPPPKCNVTERTSIGTRQIIVEFETTQKVAAGYDAVGHVKFVTGGKFTHAAVTAMSAYKPGVVQLSWIVIVIVIVII